ncbi:MAG: histidinol dehydrogenase [Butyricicoccaceae bacterium]
MFLNIVTADGAAEERVIREMKARAAGARGDIEQIVRGVMADVQQRGWDAVVEYAERFDGKAPYIVEQKVLDDAYNACDPKLIAALESRGEHPRLPRQMLVKTWEWNRSKAARSDRARLSRVGIYVPGGTAAYPSSVLMNAIPAKVAGVGELIMVTPPTENMSNEVLAAAKIAGVDTVIAIGGTQAIAALTYGAGFIPQVDKIVGPGNAFVAAAKKLAFGTVDIDMIAGPSEVLVIADHTANPTYVAADLLSQAEHDKLASAVLLTDSMAQAQAISCEMERQAKLLPRWDIIKESVANYGCATIVFDDLKDACRMADVVAPEHLES